MNLNCLIIEDQLPAQRILQTYIKEISTLRLLGTCSNAIQATEHLAGENVDLIFLDINLPKISGIGFLKNLKNPPKVVITTAYPEYALEGFELDVSDYLLKPFSFERFHKAVMKVMREVDRLGINDPEYVFIKSDKEFHKLELGKIRYLKSDDNYVRIITEDKTLLQSGSLQQWMHNLSDQFVRIHKSFAINLSKVDKVAGNRVFIGSDELPIGRAFREDLLDRITP